MSAAELQDVRTVNVPLGDRAYDVLIGPGLLARAGVLIGARLGAGRCAIVTDENVARHHLGTLEAALKQDGRHVGSTTLPPGEFTKSFRELEPLCERLLELGLERGDLVVALGGGVIGDLAGFAAAILRRGVRFVQIPTSLLAQVDLIGRWQDRHRHAARQEPHRGLSSTGPRACRHRHAAHAMGRELRAGYAEVAKYGLLGDAAFFAWLEKNHKAVFALEAEPLTRAVETSVKAKAGIVGRDETEQGERALLNLGHTFGHAFEAWCGYSDRLLHGEAIAIGMAIAFRFSAALGYCDSAAADRAVAHLGAVGLPTRIGEIPGDKPGVEAMMKLMAQDKKVRGGKLTFILARGVGEAFIARDVPADTVRAFLGGEIGAA